MATTTATKLVEINVDRLDGVDRPASRRGWLVFKSEGGAAEDKSMNVEKLEKAALSLIEASAKTGTDGVVKLSEAQCSALNEIAKELGVSAEFKPEKEEPAAPAEPPAAPPAENAELSAMKTQMGELAEAVKNIGATVQAFAQKAAAQVPEPKPSTQAQGTSHVTKSAPKKMGEGLFSNLFQR